MSALSDSSPLILFARVRRIELLRDLFEESVIPPAVRAEVVADPTGRSGAVEVAASPWIRVANVNCSPGAHGLPDRLGAGESEVIALALDLDVPGLLILDDGDARRVARGRGLDVTGTAGVLLLAKEAGLVPGVRTILDELPAAGLFLSDRVYQDVLLAAHEAAV